MMSTARSLRGGESVTAKSKSSSYDDNHDVGGQTSDASSSEIQVARKEQSAVFWSRVIVFIVLAVVVVIFSFTMHRLISNNEDETFESQVRAHIPLSPVHGGGLTTIVLSVLVLSV